MSRKLSGRLHAGAFAVVASLVLAVPTAFADVIPIDFESGPPALYFQGESFTEAEYTMTVDGDFGVVDSGVACMIAECPTGNDTQFYSGLNDGRLEIVRNDGGGFRLVGFLAGFLSPIFQDPGVLPGRIVVAGTGASGTVVLQFAFAPSGPDGTFAFTQFGGPDLAGDLGTVTSLVFYACTFTDTGACENSNQNLSQFSVDNIQLQTVPEPSTLLLLASGLLVLALRRRTVR